MIKRILLGAVLVIAVMALGSGKGNTKSVRLGDRDAAFAKPQKVYVEKDSSMNIINRHKIPATDDPLWRYDPEMAWRQLEEEVEGKLKAFADDINEGKKKKASRDDLQLLADLVAATGLKNMMTLGSRDPRNLQLKSRLDAAHWLGQYRVLLSYREDRTFATDLLPNEKDAESTLDEDTLAVLKSYAEATVRQLSMFFNPDDLAPRSNEYADEYAARLKNAQQRFEHFLKIFESCERKPLKGLIDDFCRRASKIVGSVARHLGDRYFLANADELEELDPVTQKYRDFDHEIKSLKNAIEQL